MKYDTPIESVEHANWCLEEAEKRYCGDVYIDKYGMFVIEQENGITHTDDVLREISFFVRENLSDSTAEKIAALLGSSLMEVK